MLNFFSVRSALLLAALGILLSQNKAVSAEYTSRSGPGTPCATVDPSASRHVAEVCFHFHLIYNVDVLLGEPVVESRVAWTLDKVRLKNGVGTNEILAHSAQHVDERVSEAVKQIKLSSATFSGRLPSTIANATLGPVWLPLRPGAFSASGAGHSYNTPGSPSWDGLFINSDDACSSSEFLKRRQAQSLFKGGIEITRVKLCNVQFANLAKLDQVLEDACIVSLGSNKECKSKKGSAAKKKPSLAEALQESLANELTKQDGTASESPLSVVKASADAVDQATAKFKAQRQDIDDQHEKALQMCKDGKPTRPMKEVKGLHLTSEPRTGPCSSGPDSDYDACEQIKRENRRREREEEARKEERFQEAVATYEREIAVWPQTLAQCERDAEASLAAAIRSHDLAVRKAAIEIERRRRAQDDLSKSLSKALGSASNK